MQDFSWRPIEPISAADRAIDLAPMQSLYGSWLEAKKRLELSSGSRLREYNQKLVRRLSVETGILERLYDLDRGTTEALVTKGFFEDLVSKSSTDTEPHRLIDILKDQEAAIQLVVDCVANSRPLTKGVIHELHAILTSHQDTTQGVDELGVRREIPLLKGAFKQLPNNPKRPDGFIHEYCPPIHVESEMDQLLQGFHAAKDEDPLLLATWLHHRFTQIHPYQDGNGRVARALTTMALLRAELLPLVLDRDRRVDYLNALETADRGDLAPLVHLFAGLESTAILRALSLDVDTEMVNQQTLTSAVIESLSHKLQQRQKKKVDEWRGVNKIAKILRSQAKDSIGEVFRKFEMGVSALGVPKSYVTSGGTDQGNGYFYKFQVVETAKAAEKFANLSEDHYFIKGVLELLQDRLVFVTSFHHVGRELTGIMEATAFAQLRSTDDRDNGGDGDQGYFSCSLEPFVFSYNSKAENLTDSFGRWLDASLAVALKEFADRL